MLSPRSEEDTMPTQSIAERGSRTVEGQESNMSGMFSLLTEMRE